MNVSELRARSVAELQGELEELLKQQFDLRMEHGAGQLAGTHQLRQVRRDIARVRTVMTQKQNESGEA